MSFSLSPPRSFGRLLAFGLAAIAALFPLVLWWRASQTSRPTELTMTAGSRFGLRHDIAVTLADAASMRGVVLQMTPTTGSQEAVRLVGQGKIDLALIQGGLSGSLLGNVRTAAVLHVEPLHFLVKPDEDSPKVGQFTLESLSEWFFQRPDVTINISTEGSGTHALATSLFRFFGLQTGEQFRPMTLSYEQLMEPERSTAELPDAVFTVSSLPSPVAQHLISRHGFRPVELPIAEAFRIDWSPTRAESRSNQVVHRHIVETTIPSFTYQVHPPVPAQPIATVGTRLHLIAHRDTPIEAVEDLVAAVYESSFANTSQPPLTVQLLQTAAESDLHAGAAAYVRKKTPMITEHAVDLTEKSLAILGSIFAGVIFAWQALAFVRRRRRDRQFLSCIERVGQIEQRALQFERDDAMSVEALIRLQEELNQIKTEMVRQFQSGDIDGADTLSGFLIHVNDANENLTRTILHERSPKAER